MYFTTTTKNRRKQLRELISPEGLVVLQTNNTVTINPSLPLNHTVTPCLLRLSILPRVTPIVYFSFKMSKHYSCYTRLVLKQQRID